MATKDFSEDHIRKIIVELGKREKLGNELLELEKKTKDVKNELGKVNYFLKIYHPNRLKEINVKYKKEKIHEEKETPRQMAENALLKLEGEGKAEVIFRLMRKEGYKGSLTACHSVLQRAHKNKRSSIRRTDGETGYYTYGPDTNNLTVEII